MFKRFFKRKKDKDKKLENKVEEILTKEDDTLEEGLEEVSEVIEETVENIEKHDNDFNQELFTKTTTNNNTIVLEDLVEESLDVEEILDDILSTQIEEEDIDTVSIELLDEEVEKNEKYIENKNLSTENLLEETVDEDINIVDEPEITNLTIESTQEEIDQCSEIEFIKEENICNEEVLDEVDISMGDDIIEEDELNNSEEEESYILDIKIKRGKGIKVRDLYTEEEQIFKTHKECSRKLKLPLGYIKENLKYGHTDYLGQAINFLTKELHTSLEDEAEFDEFAYLENSKTPMEQFSILNDKIFKARISESKRDLILSSIKIEPVKMHYTFECIDNEYNDYFEKYKSIILRGGKKKIELVSKNGEAIEIFKSIDECANYLNKDREEVVDMLKCGNTKAGRYEIRYSLRSI